MHGGDSFWHSKVSTVVAYTAHYTFIDSLMDGEQFNYSSGHTYYLLWDAMGIADYDMYGYWDELTPVKVNGGGDNVKATAFVLP
eukprot:COSAG05_NODE_8196_length_727_cov_1.328025_1_plen_83_part_01